MSATRKIATVFGGSGFIGRYVVKRLAAQGYIVRVAVRDTEAAKFLRPMGDVGQIVLLHAPLHEEALVARAVEGAEIVVNLAGILNERRKGDFLRVHEQGAGRVARLAASSMVGKLVHVSALGADAASPSLYGQSKAAGEVAVRAAFPGAVILRPSVVFGAEDQFFNRFATMAGLLRVVPIVSGGTKFQPVYVGDVADAVVAGLSAGAVGKTYELGGPEVAAFKALMERMLKVTEQEACVVDLPLGLAKVQALFLERLPGKLLTTDQIKMLARDNVVSPGALDLASLGVAATPMDLILPGYLARHRDSGGRRAALVSE
jgi:NADH dehydrogenase